MICMKCQALGEQSSEVFTKMERVFILTAAATMMRWIEANPNAKEQDKMVGNSVVTKVLLSFPEEGREVLLKAYRESSGIGMTLKSCPHGVLEVVK